MANERVLVAFRLHAASPLAIGPNGLPVDSAGLPVIRGGTIKGAMRQLTSRLAMALGDAPCIGDGSPTCRICRLFGAPGLEAALRWSDALAVRDAMGGDSPSRAVHSSIEWRSRQPVDRARRTNEGQARIQHTVTMTGFVFESHVEGWLPSDQEGDPRQIIGFLVATLRRLRHLGGRHSIGRGTVEVDVTAIRIGDAQYSGDEMVAALSPVGAVS